MPGRLRAGVDERQDLLVHVLVEHPLPPAAMERMRALVQERLHVVGADAEDLDASAVDELAQRVDQPLTVQLPLVAVAGGEGEQRRPPVAEDRDPHVVTEPGRIPDVMFDAHRCRL